MPILMKSYLNSKIKMPLTIVEITTWIKMPLPANDKILDLEAVARCLRLSLGFISLKNSVATICLDFSFSFQLLPLQNLHYQLSLSSRTSTFVIHKVITFVLLIFALFTRFMVILVENLNQIPKWRICVVMLFEPPFLRI